VKCANVAEALITGTEFGFTLLNIFNVKINKTVNNFKTFSETHDILFIHLKDAL